MTNEELMLVLINVSTVVILVTRIQYKYKLFKHWITYLVIANFLFTLMITFQHPEVINRTVHCEHRKAALIYDVAFTALLASGGMIPTAVINVFTIIVQQNSYKEAVK